MEEWRNLTITRSSRRILQSPPSSICLQRPEPVAQGRRVINLRGRHTAEHPQRAPQVRSLMQPATLWRWAARRVVDQTLESFVLGLELCSHTSSVCESRLRVQLAAMPNNGPA